uniref:Uncharacterized protein n=1 Tax=Arundo donax TaxID=35708 RepID=A0A0A9EGX7_ARUDO
MKYLEISGIRMIRMLFTQKDYVSDWMGEHTQRGRSRLPVGSCLLESYLGIAAQ